MLTCQELRASVATGGDQLWGALPIYKNLPISLANVHFRGSTTTHVQRDHAGTSWVTGTHGKHLRIVLPELGDGTNWNAVKLVLPPSLHTNTHPKTDFNTSWNLSFDAHSRRWLYALSLWLVGPRMHRGLQLPSGHCGALRSSNSLRNPQLGAQFPTVFSPKSLPTTSYWATMAAHWWVAPYWCYQHKTAIYMMHTQYSGPTLGAQ